MPPGNLVDKLRVLVQQTEARSTLRTSSGRTDSCNAWRQYFADRNTEWIKKMDDPFAPGELEQWAAGMPDKLEPRQPRATQTNAEAAVKVHIERALEDSIRAAVGKVEKGINVKIDKLEEEIRQLRTELQLQRAAERADVIDLPALPLRRRSNAA
jgi:hypothetical protein